jgi:hypothetical protein
LDQDGLDEIITTSYSLPTLSDLYVLHNQNGVYGSPTPIPLPLLRKTITLGHFDQGPFPDLVVLDAEFPARQLRIIRNVSGVLSPAVVIESAVGASIVIAADFDSDGFQDLFLLMQGGPSRMLVNDGNANFYGVNIGISGYLAAAGDINGDGLPDLYVDEQIWFNSGGFSFAAGPAIPYVYGGSAWLMDIDEDGSIDLLDGSGGHRRHLGGGLFAPPLAPIGGYLFGVAGTPVDLDRDGDLDAVSTSGVVMMNTTRHVHLPLFPRVGRPTSVKLYGDASGIYFLFGSAFSADIPMGPHGRAFLDPTRMFLAQLGTFGVAFSSDERVATFNGIVPADPSLVGQTLYWQVLDQNLRLSNRATMTFGL